MSFEKFAEQEKVEMSSTNPNEQNLSRCMALADVTLLNNGTIEDFKVAIEDFITKLK